MQTASEYVIGIDIGGTNTEFCVVDRMGRFYYKAALSTKMYDTADDLLEAIHTQLAPEIQRLGPSTIKGVGIGAPAANALTGLMMETANINWQGITPLAQLSTQLFGWPTAINNDANVCAIGELIYGQAIGVKDFIVITLGTGIGSGIVSNGQLVLGHDGFAGELGHVIIHEDGRPCGCGRKGCFETYASATGIVKTAYNFLENDSRTEVQNSILKHHQLTSEILTAKMIFEAAQNGDALALEIFNYTGTIIGKFLANAVAFSSPQKIILFGGLAQAQELLLQPIRTAFESNALYLYQQKIDIEISRLDASTAALLGAAALAWNIQA